MPTNGFSIQPPKVKLFAGEQKATEVYSCTRLQRGGDFDVRARFGASGVDPRAQVVLREAILSCVTPDRSRLPLLEAPGPQAEGGWKQSACGAEVCGVADGTILG